jgi:hypothetical protein
MSTVRPCEAPCIFSQVMIFMMAPTDMWGGRCWKWLRFVGRATCRGLEGRAPKQLLPTLDSAQKYTAKLQHINNHKNSSSIYTLVFSLYCYKYVIIVPQAVGRKPEELREVLTRRTCYASLHGTSTPNFFWLYTGYIVHLLHGLP